MNEILVDSLHIIYFLLYTAVIITTMTMPIWGYKLLENRLLGKHKHLRLAKYTKGYRYRSTRIIASIGTTTVGVFIIQILPLIFSVINDIGGSFAVNTVYSDRLLSSGIGEYVDSFYSLTAQLGDMVQTVAPMAAVGLGGYNLLTNLSRGLPAIKRNG